MRVVCVKSVCYVIGMLRAALTPMAVVCLVAMIFTQIAQIKLYDLSLYLIIDY